MVLLAVVSAVALIAAIPDPLEADSEGANSPSTAVNDTGIGSVAWTGAGNVTGSEDTRASVTMSSNSTPSNYIKATGFGFSVPTGSTVNGIVAEVERSEGSTDGSNACVDNAVRIVKGGTIGSTDQSAAGDWPATDAYATYGNSTYKWGDSWSVSDINASDFGFAISAANSRSGGNPNNTEVCRVDHIRITIHYTLPPTVYTQSAYRWFTNDNSTDVGSVLADQDTTATAPAKDTSFRLRMAIHVGTTNLAQSGETFKLQYAKKGGGSCASPGDAYADVTTSSAIQYYDNASASDGVALTTNANDPQHSTHTTRAQTYEEANNFTNSQAAIAVGEDGLWDFALVDDSADYGANYCFKAVLSGGSDIDSYGVYPEITTAAAPTIDQSAYRWFEHIDEGNGYNWWDTDWGARRKITFNNSASTKDLTNFTVLIQLTSSEIDYSKVQNSGQDLRFVDSDGSNALAYEIEEWNESGTSYVWVEVPQIDSGSSSDHIWMYYDNDSATDAQNASGTWDNSYEAVWHLNEDPTGSAPQFTDSTGNGHNATSNGSWVSGDSVTGVVSKGLVFSGNDEFLTVSHNSNLNFNTDYTIEFWMKMGSEPANDLFPPVLSKGTWTSNGWLLYMNDSDNSLRTSRNGNDNATTATNVTSNSVFRNYAITFKDSTDDQNAYVDGSLSLNSTMNFTDTTNTSSLLIGRSDRYIYGYIDEIRLSTTERSADWIDAQDLSMTDSFASYSSEQSHSTGVGSTLAAQDTSATLASTGQAFRLRMDLHINTNKLKSSGQNFKLQVAKKGTGSCDSPEFSYGDVSPSSGDIRYNSSGNDGIPLTDNANDPVHSGHTNNNQTYEEANNFTNSVLAIPAGEDGLWDFALVDDSAPGDTAYCFKAVDSGGSTLNSYGVYPEITTFDTGGGGTTADIVDAAGDTVASPSFSLNAHTLSFACTAVSGSFGASSQRIRVTNSFTAENWDLTLAATSGAGASWSGGPTDYDFNDGGGSPAGCGDGVDGDSLVGQMSFDPSVGTLTPKTGCSSTGITKGSSSSFVEGTTDNLTILSGTTASDTDCYWELTGVDVDQQIPADQPTGSYSINMTLTLTVF